MRTVKIGRYRSPEYFDGTIFKSNTYQFRRSNAKFDISIAAYAENGSAKEHGFNSIDASLTQYLRDNSRSYNTFFSMNKLIETPIYPMEDGASLLLPLNNKYGLDWLTYNHPLWRTFICKLVDELLRNKPPGESDTFEENVLKLLTNYSYSELYTHAMGRTGSFEISAEDCGPFKGTDLTVLRSCWTAYFRDQVFKPLQQEDLPSIKPYKSPGFNSTYPDGTPFTKKDAFIVPLSQRASYPHTAYRYSYSDLKLAWVNSGALEDNIKFFLDNYESYDQPAVLLSAFKREAMNIHTRAFRSNQPDKVLDYRPELSCEQNLTKPDMCTKNRPADFETEPLQWTSILFDTKKWRNVMIDANDSNFFPGVALRARSIFPAPNASFSPPFITLFNVLLHIEKGAAGFPSNRTNVLSRYKNFYSAYAGRIKILTFDRKSAEECISDNFKYVRQLFPERFARMLDALTVCVCPSAHGPRVSTGTMFSGAAVTTFLNVVFGTSQMIVTLADLLNVNGKERDTFIKDAFACYLTGEVLRYKGASILLNLGTDDQIALIADYSGEDLPKSYYDERMLSGELCEDTTVFGLRFTSFDVAESTTSNITKMFLMEHTKTGDAAALKMMLRLQMLPQYRDVIQKVFTDMGFGDISTYDRGARNYLTKILGDWGFAIDPIFNEYSPVDQNLIRLLSQDSTVVRPEDIAKLYDTGEFATTFSPLASTKYPLPEFSKMFEMLRDEAFSI